jgi:hypothetical protein
MGADTVAEKQQRWRSITTVRLRVDGSMEKVGRGSVWRREKGSWYKGGTVSDKRKGEERRKARKGIHRR